MPNKQKRSKKHHIVPKTLQKHFANPQGKIWYSERNSSGCFGKPQPRNIDSTFKARNQYTVLIDDKPSDFVEREIYGKLDDFLGLIIPQFLDIVANNQVPEIAPDDLEALRIAILETAKRTPDFGESESDFEIGLKFVDEMLNEIGNEYPEYREELLVVCNNRSKLVQYGRDIRVRGSLMPSERTHSVLQQFVPRWVKIDSKHSFILSGKMVYRIGNGGPNGLANKNAEVWMPVSPKVALVLLRDPDNEIPQLSVAPRDRIRDINSYACRNSSQIASHSEKLLLSLI